MKPSSPASASSSPASAPKASIPSTAPTRPRGAGTITGRRATPSPVRSTTWIPGSSSECGRFDPVEVSPRSSLLMASSAHCRNSCASCSWFRPAKCGSAVHTERSRSMGSYTDSRPLQMASRSACTSAAIGSALPTANASAIAAAPRRVRSDGAAPPRNALIPSLPPPSRAPPMRSAAAAGACSCRPRSLRARATSATVSFESMYCRNAGTAFSACRTEFM
mmetsp:Transcript_5035/g.20047  ORF Transcript_5035/g.20047 Transcript_5035/m.20047 type:complete len:221 (+) Transcript_5035:588-1250(+)